MPGILRRGLGELGSWKEWRLSTKIMVVFLAVALGSIFFISKQTNQSYTDALTHVAEDRQTSVADTVAIQVDSQVLLYRNEAVQVATDPDVISFMSLPPDQQNQAGAALLKRLTPVLSTDPDYRLVLMIRASGEVALSNEPGLQGQAFNEQDFFRQGMAAASGTPYFSDISLAEDRQHQLMYVAEPIRDAVGKTLGVAAIRLSPDRVAAPLHSAKVTQGNKSAFLVNRVGVVLANSSSPAINYRSLGSLDATQAAEVKKQFLLDRVDSLGLDDLANQVAGATGSGFTQAHLFKTVGSQENDVIGYAPVQHQRWTVMVSQNQAVFTKGVNDLSNGQLFLTLILALIIGGLVIFAGRMFETTERESLSDPLTGLANRRFFQEILLRELRRAQRGNTPVTLLICDIDHFKGVNDTYGHNVGDEVLEQVAGIMLSTVRATDFVIRYGGEEFVILLPETRLADAVAVADKLRKTVGDTILESTSRPGITLKVTISTGVATFPSDGNTGEQVILKADKALYFAKQSGRNRVCTVAEMEGDGATPLAMPAGSKR
jgi:diguanylate cyclase (GGDEF)-like protein